MGGWEGGGNNGSDDVREGGSERVCRKRGRDEGANDRGRDGKREREWRTEMSGGGRERGREGTLERGRGAREERGREGRKEQLRERESSREVLSAAMYSIQYTVYSI